MILPMTLEEQLQRINELGLWDFAASSSDEGHLLVLGSNDFAYYHDLELEFRGVRFHDLPPAFSHARFRLDATRSDPVIVWITAVPADDVSERELEIQARAVSVRIGKVYYYDRPDLKPGERIAGKP